MKQLKNLLSLKNDKDYMAYAKWVNQENSRIAGLVDIILYREDRTAHKAVNVLLCLDKIDPTALKSQTEKMEKHLISSSPPHMQKRNLLRIMANTPRKYVQTLNLYDRCADICGSPKETIAVRSFAIAIITRIALEIQELISPTMDILEFIEENEQPSPGIKSRLRRCKSLLIKGRK